jgi:hypothetical protein
MLGAGPRIARHQYVTLSGRECRRAALLPAAFQPTSAQT